jgi:hypothetical protein
VTDRLFAYRAARQWAHDHGHPQPDDCMIDAALAATHLDPAAVTIADYTQAITRATAALWRHLPSDVQEGRRESDVQLWVNVVVEAFAAYPDKPTPPPADADGQCGAAGPDGERCERAANHQPILDGENDHAAYSDESGGLVRW